jgi:hypothetical protein
MLKKAVKKLGLWDIQLIKLSVVAFVLFVISFLPQNAIDFIVEWRWVWFVLFVLFAIKPTVKAWLK